MITMTSSGQNAKLLQVLKDVNTQNSEYNFDEAGEIMDKMKD